MKWTLLCLIFLAGCKNEDENNPQTEFFPVLPYLQSQVAHVDTSVYSIMQVTRSGNRSDTVFLKREDFRKAASDFLSIPDISSGKLKKKYRETRLFDEDIQKVIVTYETKEEDVDIVREDIIILPSLGNENEVESIYIERFMEAKNGHVQKKMLWEVNKRFQVTSIIPAGKEPEKIETVEVRWTDTR